jgi:hypothetical protein
MMLDSRASIVAPRPMMMDPRVQVRCVEGLGDEVVAAGLDPFQAIAAVRFRGRDDDRRAQCARSPARPEAIRRPNVSW